MDEHSKECLVCKNSSSGCNFYKVNAKTREKCEKHFKMKLEDGMLCQRCYDQWRSSSQSPRYSLRSSTLPSTPSTSSSVDNNNNNNSTLTDKCCVCTRTVAPGDRARWTSLKTHRLALHRDFVSVPEENLFVCKDCYRIDYKTYPELFGIYSDSVEEEEDQEDGQLQQQNQKKRKNEEPSPARSTRTSLRSSSSTSSNVNNNNNSSSSSINIALIDKCCLCAGTAPPGARVFWSTIKTDLLTLHKDFVSVPKEMRVVCKSCYKRDRSEFLKRQNSDREQKEQEEQEQEQEEQEEQAQDQDQDQEQQQQQQQKKKKKNKEPQHTAVSQPQPQPQPQPPASPQSPLPAALPSNSTSNINNSNNNNNADSRPSPVEVVVQRLGRSQKVLIVWHKHEVDTLSKFCAHVTRCLRQVSHLGANEHVEQIWDQDKMVITDLYSIQPGRSFLAATADDVRKMT